ncbi:MAG: protein kinase [Polyangiaceae bacterium]
MEIAPGAVIGGKYRIERALARGGMGSVWVARHVQLGSTLAVKFLDASFAASAAHRARFEREARSAANLKSPHVVHVQDYGFEDESPYIVMELLEGEDLSQRLHRVRRLSTHDTARILVQVGKALRKAHEAGIAHRDLKPANLFLARVDDDEVVKVLDFGIAKEQHGIAGEATRTGEVIGSPHYMSPEQVRAEKDIDHRTDLWSLGIILYRMLVGSLPFPGDQLGPVLAKILTDPIPVPTQHAPDLPPTLDPFFARALARDKHQRFQSIHELVDAFQAAAGGRDAFPSISMSLGTGQSPVAAGGTALWTPQPQGPLTGSGPVTGHNPLTGSGPMGASGPLTGSGPMGASGPLTGSGPMGASGPIGASGPYPHGMAGGVPGHTGPVTTGGLASTGPAPKPKGGAIIAIVLSVTALAAAGAGIFFLRGGSADPTPAADGHPPSALALAPTVEPTATATAEPTAAATAEPTAEPSADPEPTTAAATTKPPATYTPPPVVKPKPPATTKPKEKWF